MECNILDKSLTRLIDQLFLYVVAFIRLQLILPITKTSNVNLLVKSLYMMYQKLRHVYVYKNICICITRTQFQIKTNNCKK